MVTVAGCKTRCPIEMRSLLIVSEAFTISIGSTASSNKATNHTIGRENFKSPSPQRINRLPSKLKIHCGIISVRTSARGRPGILWRTKTNSPLSVGRISKASNSTPCFLAKPSAALVGLPSLNAACAGGPLISSTLSGCWVGRPLISTARRRGVPYTSTDSVSRLFSVKLAGMSDRHCLMALSTKFAGNSSVPTSNRKLGIANYFLTGQGFILQRTSYNSLSCQEF